MTARKALFAATVAAAVLAGCAKEGDIVVEQGVGITALRSVCPAVGVPDFTGNVTITATGGKANPAVVNEILKRKLGV